MRYTTFGRTGLSVSQLSMGCNRLGDPGVDPAEWPPVVQKALDMGVTFFDTSENYNEGRSEAVLGAVISGQDRPTVIATKGGFSTGATIVRDFSAESILKAGRGSLEHAPQPDGRPAQGRNLPACRRAAQSRGNYPVFRHLNIQPRIGHLRCRACRRGLPPDRVRPAQSDRRG
jgi:hypothetical protein